MEIFLKNRVFHIGWFMKFLVLIFSLLILRYTGIRQYRRNDRRLGATLRKLSNLLPASIIPPIGRYLLIVFIPVLLTSLFFWWLNSVWWGVISLVLQTLLLIYLILPALIQTRLKTFMDVWRTGNIEESHSLATEYFQISSHHSLSHRRALFEQVKEQITYLWFDHLFVIVLWYLVFGPAGALVPALTSLYLRNVVDQDEYVQLLPIQYAIEWLPVRLLGLTFALTGNFVQTFKQWWQSMLDIDMHSKAFLNRCRESALHREDEETTDNFFQTTAEELQAVDDLAFRSALFWISILAVTTLLGWNGF